MADASTPPSVEVAPPTAGPADAPSTPTPPGVLDLCVGDLVGRYRIEELLGEGGMARVYGLRHADHDYTAALKVPRAGLDPELRERFLLEAGAHLNLNGKRHIVSPLETGRLPPPDERPFLIMQRVDGVTLEYYNRDPQNDLEGAENRRRRMIRFCIQVARALDKAHSMPSPIIHRDVKPSNVYVAKVETEEVAGMAVEYVLLGDFGLAWRPGDEVLPVGTPEYCSPEQASHQTPTIRSDLYSLGVMMYELIEGRLPFQDNDVKRLLGLHLSEPVPPMQNAGRFEPVIKHLLAKHPEERPRSAQEVITVLTRLLFIDEGRDQVTHVGPAPKAPSPPTDRLPAPAFEADAPATRRLQPPEPLAGFADRERVAAALPQWRRPVTIVALVLLVMAGAFVASRMVPKDDPAPPPVKPVEVAAVAVVQPVALPAPSEPVPVPVPPDELAPLAKVEPPKPKPAVKPVEPKVTCEPTHEWKQMMFGNLAAVETYANKMSALEVSQESDRVGRIVHEAQTPKECARAIAEFEALKNRAIK